jgi:hypothetical protein
MMAGNKNSGRRDSLPRGGGRPRTWVHIAPQSEYGAYLREIVAAWQAGIPEREVTYTPQKVVEDLIIGEVLRLRRGE